MPNENRPGQRSGYGELRPIPPQPFVRTEVPSIEGAVKGLTGVSLPFADVSRGAGSLANNMAVVGSHPLLSGLTGGAPPAENEIFPVNPTDLEVQVLSSPARWEPDSTGDPMDLMRRRSSIAGPQETDMRSLLNRRASVLDGLRASRGGPSMPGEGA